MKIEITILGLLMQGNLYGYEIKKRIVENLEDYVDNDTILEDIRDILSSRAEQAYQEFTRLNNLEHKLCYQQTTD